jgi:hypothetical protein
VDFSEEFHPAAFFSFSSSLNSSTVANLSEKFHRSMLSASRVTAHISIPHLNLFFSFSSFYNLIPNTATSTWFRNSYMGIVRCLWMALTLGFDYLPRKKKTRVLGLIGGRK